MSEPFVAEIRIFAGNFSPRGWAFCNGQLLPVSQNTALFSLIGTTYGGDGRSTMALPDLQGRAPMHPGNGPGLTARRLGERGGTEQVTLSEAQMPSHHHSVQGPTTGRSGVANAKDPANAIFAITEGDSYSDATSSPVDMAPGVLPVTGGSQPHNNMQPLLTMNFIIALVGLYPSRP